MAKALIYTYLSKGQFKIKNISFESNNKENIIKENEISQVFTNDNAELKALNINDDFKNMFFANSVDSHELVKTLMYLILSYQEKKYTFDNSWKAFNSIINSLNNAKSDFENLRYIRRLLDDNKDKFKKTIEFSKQVDLDYLNVCKTNSMIKNNYPKLKSNQSSKEANKVIKELYKNYSDSLLCEYLESKMPCKKMYYKKQVAIRRRQTISEPKKKNKFLNR